MTTAGPFSPSSVTSTQVSFFGETVPWSDPANAVSSDDSYATVALARNDLSYALRCTGFGLTNSDVPPGATIDGVLVEIEVSQDGDAVSAMSPLVYGGSQISDPGLGLGNSAGNSGFTPDATDTYWPLGDATDTGNAALTQDMVVDSSFGIDIYFAGGSFVFGSTVSVDHVRMTVYYTLSGAYSLAADGGSFTLTGTAVGLKRGRRLVVGSGAFALTGQALTLKQGRKLTIGSGSFSLAGQAVTLSHGRPLTIGSGSFTLTGSALTLKYGRRLVVGSGSFAFTGSTLGLLKGYSFAAGSGTFTLAGQSITFPRSYRIAIGSGSFALAGQAVSLNRGYRLPVGSGAFALAGQALNFLRGKRVVIGSGSFALTGQALAFARTKSLLMAPGTFTFTGSALSFRHSTPLGMGSGTFILTGMRIGPFPRQPSVVRVFVPTEAPRWFTAVARSIERELRDRRLTEVGEAADLPDAADYRSRMLRITGLDVVAVSNGTNWIRLDTGATL